MGSPLGSTPEQLDALIVLQAFTAGAALMAAAVTVTAFIVQHR